MAANTIVQAVYDQVLRRNPGEAEFHQVEVEAGVVGPFDALDVRTAAEQNDGQQQRGDG